LNFKLYNILRVIERFKSNDNLNGRNGHISHTGRLVVSQKQHFDILVFAAQTKQGQNYSHGDKNKKIRVYMRIECQINMV